MTSPDRKALAETVEEQLDVLAHIPGTEEESNALVEARAALAVLAEPCQQCEALRERLAEDESVIGEQYDYDTLLFRFVESRRTTREYQQYAGELRGKLAEAEERAEDHLSDFQSEQRRCAMIDADRVSAEARLAEAERNWKAGVEVSARYIDERDSAEARAVRAEQRAAALEARLEQARAVIRALVAAFNLVLEVKPVPVEGNLCTIDIKDGLYAMQQAIGPARSWLAAADAREGETA